MKQTILYYFFITSLVLLTVNPSSNFAKGNGGTYILTGLALSKTGDTLKNQVILMHFKDKVDTLQTDAQGYYKTRIKWSTACPSGMNGWQRIRATKKNNPKYILFSFNDIKIKVKNDWKFFLTVDRNIPEAEVKNENLIF